MILGIVVALNSHMALASNTLYQCENGNISFSLIRQEGNTHVGLLQDLNNRNRNVIEFACELSVIPRRGSRPVYVCSSVPNSMNILADVSSTKAQIYLSDSRKIELQCRHSRSSRFSYEAARSRCYKLPNGKWNCPR